MFLQSLVFFFAFFVISDFFSFTASTGICRTLEDKNAPLWKGVGINVALLYYGGKEKIINEKIKLFNLPPILSQCLANIKVSTAHLASLGMSKSCRSMATQVFPRIFYPTGNQFQVNPIYNEAIQQFSSLANVTTDFYVFGNFAQWVYDNSQYLPEQCEHVYGKFNPCFFNKILPFYISRIPKTPCCKPLLDTIETFTGQQLSMNLIKDIILPIEDMICAKQERFFTPNWRTCGKAFARTIFDSNVLFNILSFIQVPNDQACLAFRGKSFKTTSDTKERLGSYLSCCSNYWDSLVTKLSQMPGVKKLIPSSLFENGTCLSKNEFPFNLPEEANMLFSDICMHLANGFKGKCGMRSQCSGASDYGIDYRYKQNYDTVTAP